MQRIFISIMVLCLLCPANINCSAESKQKATVYPIGQSFSSLELTASNLNRIKKLKLDFTQCAGIGVEITRDDDQDDLQVWYGLEYVNTRAHNFSYSTQSNLVVQNSAVNYLFVYVTPYIRWRRFMNDKLWYWSIETGLPFVRTSSRPVNELVSFKTPFMAGVSLGVPLYENIFLEISSRRCLYAGETVHLAKAPDLDREFYSSFEMNTTLVSIKTFLDI